LNNLKQKIEHNQEEDRTQPGRRSKLVFKVHIQQRGEDRAHIEQKLPSIIW